MNTQYFYRILTENDHSNIKQITTTSLIRVFFERIVPNTFTIDTKNEVFYYIDDVTNEKVVIDIEDVNCIVGKSDLILPDGPPPVDPTPNDDSDNMGGTGPQGPSGESGPVSPSGDSGPQGPSGESGPVSPSGDSGPQGPSGESGPVSPSGDSGSQGSSGESGAVSS